MEKKASDKKSTCTSVKEAYEILVACKSEKNLIVAFIFLKCAHCHKTVLKF